jgi:hypothetical protein
LYLSEILSNGRMLAVESRVSGWSELNGMILLLLLYEQQVRSSTSIVKQDYSITYRRVLMARCNTGSDQQEGGCGSSRDEQDTVGVVRSHGGYTLLFAEINEQTRHNTVVARNCSVAHSPF